MTPASPALTRILVGRGALAHAADEVRECAIVLLVADASLERVARGLATTMGAQRPVALELLPGGDASKSLATAEALWDRWLATGAGRDALVVALGGGSITDVAGFAAACFLRGVPWVAIPSTVLGMADAAIGGKTGVNTGAGKNLVGALHAPQAVLADLDLLAGLSEAAYADGWAEVVKAGVIGDAALFEDLERDAAAVRRRDLGVVEDLLARAIRVKVAVVEADACESSRREILNFGHTVAHALEAATRGAMSHGRAVAVGMVAEGWLAEARGRLSSVDVARIAAACRALGLDRSVAPGIRDEDLRAALSKDKKRRAGQLRVALPSGLGSHDAAPGVTCDPRELMDALARARAL